MSVSVQEMQDWQKLFDEMERDGRIYRAGFDSHGRQLYRLTPTAERVAAINAVYGAGTCEVIRGGKAGDTDGEVIGIRTLREYIETPESKRRVLEEETRCWKKAQAQECYDETQ